MADRAVFFDRDNTLIEDSGFIDDPERVRLKPGAAEAVRRVRACGHRAVIVSNQSGVARGLFDETRLKQVHDRLIEVLEQQGARIDGVYYCPYLDGAEAVVEGYRRDSELRKPRPGMLLKAARELELDLSRSWMVGDRLTDVQAGVAAGCRTVLVGKAGSRHDDGEDDGGANDGGGVGGGGAVPDYEVSSVEEAARIVEKESKQPAPVNHSGPPVPNQDLLEEIRQRLDHRDRREHQDDFSLIRLVGSLMQMLAIVSALWGAVGLFGESTVPSIARFGLAIFLQLLALSIFMTHRRG